MIKKMAPKRKATQEITIETKEIIASAHGAKHLVDPSKHSYPHYQKSFAVKNH